MEELIKGRSRTVRHLLTRRRSAVLSLLQQSIGELNGSESHISARVSSGRRRRRLTPVPLPGPFRAPQRGVSRVSRLMNSDAVLAFSASTASSLRFPSKANKEIKRASERRRGLSSTAERSERASAQRRRGTESLLLAGLSFYLSRLQILSDFCLLVSVRQRGWTAIQNARRQQLESADVSSRLPGGDQQSASHLWPDAFMLSCWRGRRTPSMLDGGC